MILTEISRTGPCPLPLDDAMEELRREYREDQALVSRNILRAVRYVEDRAKLTLYPAVQRKLSIETWGNCYGDRWGYQHIDSTIRTIRLTLPPWVSTDSVTYYDADDDQQTVNASLYNTILIDDAPAILEWDDAFTYPSLRSRRDAVQITYTTGTASPDPVAVTAATLFLKFLIDDSPDHKQAADELIGDLRNTSYGQAPTEST